jgi:hypothetical protein
MIISRQYFHVTRKVRKLRKSINMTGRKSLPLARSTYRKP